MQRLFQFHLGRISQDVTFKTAFLISSQVVLWATLAMLVSQCAIAFGQSQTELSNATGLYARVLRLSHNGDASMNGKIVASVTAFPNGAAEEDVYTSADGVTFSSTGTVKDADFSEGLCCGTLYELPSQVGAMSPGTLLWAGSVGQSSTTKPMQIKIYQSADQGSTWSYLSNCATAATPKSIGGGLWEPQFEIADDGALVCFYSDETQAGYSQLIHQVRSYDGINWQDSYFTVASTIQADRPGMPVVTKLPSGTYFMTYELCGPAACTVFSRTSADGWNWGDPTNMGNKILTGAGQWFEHAPTNAWAASATSSSGTILVIGQVMLNSSGTVSSGNGVTIFTNHSPDGSGPWSTMPAPVHIPDAYDNYCPNYSSPMLPSTDGASVLEFASDYVGTTCTMFYATGPIAVPSAGFTVSGTSLSIAPGAVTGNSSTITITPVGGFTGSVTLTAEVISSPTGGQYPPSLSFGSTSSVNIASTVPGTATLTVSTTPATSSVLAYTKRTNGWWRMTDVSALACVLFFVIPKQRRRRRSTLACMGFVAILGCAGLGCGGALGCGGGGSTGAGSVGTSKAGTTAGTYVVKVTGTSGNIVGSSTLTLTVQ